MTSRVLVLISLAACQPDAGEGAEASTGGTGSGSTSDGDTTVATSSTSVASTGSSGGEDVPGSTSGPMPDDVPTGCIVHVEQSGDDDETCGAADAPCRTLTHAIGLAPSGCTIELGAGTFSAATGETLPWAPAPDVHIVGAGADATILDDVASTSAETFTIVCDAGNDADPVRAAVVLEGGSLASLAVHGPVQVDYHTVLVLGGEVELSDLAVVGGQEGIFVAGDAQVSIIEADVSGAGHAGIKPAGDSVVTVERSRMHGNKDALEPICRATTTVRESEAYCNGNGLEALDRAQTTMIDNDVHHNVNGIAARGAETMVIARGNLVHDNAFGAVIIFAGLDAGTEGEPGGNTFAPNQFIGMLLANVPEDTLAIGNVWMPSIDGADAAGAYPPGVVVTGPVCPEHLLEIELPPPDPCEVDVPVVPDATIRNYAMRNGTCDTPPSCGGGLPACPAMGELVLSAP